MTLRVAILTHSTNPRGGVVHALAIADALTHLGHHAVVHAPDPAGRGFFRETRCGTVSVPAEAIEGLGMAAMVKRRIADYLRFFEDPVQRRYDVYHAHDGIGGNALADLVEAGLVQGFVRTVHHLDAFADPTLAALQVRGVTAASRVLCVSDLWRDNLKREFGLDAHRVGNGVDRTMFSALPSRRDGAVRARWGLGAGPVFLSVGGFEARKNSLRIIEAFAAVYRALPGAQLLVVGGASVLDHAAYAQRCCEALTRHGLDSGPGAPVVRTGSVPQEDMPSFYRVADALLFPSLNEGFGLAVIEAMASGMPAIVSTIAPFTEYLGPEDALWCDAAEPASIAQAMRHSLDPARRATLVANGAAVAERFDWAASARRHLDLYSTLVAEREAALA